ncbi:MAG TPA: L,D-transpeptidase, partial [Chloroflexota bacterium]
NLLTSLIWSSTDSVSGIQGYSYILERQSRVIPPGQPSAQTGIRLAHLADGVWFFALRAVDRAGNWSPTATYRIQLDRQAPRLTWLSPAKFTFNPYKGATTVRFALNKDSSVHVGLYRVGSKLPVSTYVFPQVRGGRAVSITWNGKSSKGQPVGKGYYFFSAYATDRAHNVARWNVGGITVDPQQGHRAITGQMLYPGDGKRIIVSLSREALFAYDGDRLVLQTLVTTGNPSLPTPAGSYQVMGKFHPYEFISPWPAGSPYWYPPSLSNYAMLFRDGGYFLHDAPWRSVFGPGTNGPGQPGTNYGGTHGCVNIPPGPMIFLWNWTPVGTTVQVVS